MTIDYGELGELRELAIALGGGAVLLAAILAVGLAVCILLRIEGGIFASLGGLVVLQLLAVVVLAMGVTEPAPIVALLIVVATVLGLAGRGIRMLRVRND